MFLDPGNNFKSNKLLLKSNLKNKILLNSLNSIKVQSRSNKNKEGKTRKLQLN